MILAAASPSRNGILMQTVIDIIREHSHSRKQMIPTTTEMSYGYYPSMPVEVVVGGATIFVVDIERFERV